MRLGDWRGRRDSMDGVYSDVLQLDDYVLANYANGARPRPESLRCVVQLAAQGGGGPLAALLPAGGAAGKCATSISAI